MKRILFALIAFILAISCSMCSMKSANGESEVMISREEMEADINYPSMRSAAQNRIFSAEICLLLMHV